MALNLKIKKSLKHGNIWWTLRAQYQQDEYNVHATKNQFKNILMFSNIEKLINAKYPPSYIYADIICFESMIIFDMTMTNWEKLLIYGSLSKRSKSNKMQTKKDPFYDLICF